MNALGVSEVTLSKLLFMHTNDEISDTDIYDFYIVFYIANCSKKEANQRRKLKRRNFSSGKEIDRIDGIPFNEGNF